VRILRKELWWYSPQLLSGVKSRTQIVNKHLKTAKQHGVGRTRVSVYLGRILGSKEQQALRKAHDIVVGSTVLVHGSHRQAQPPCLDDLCNAIESRSANIT
jgi:hypothetical protein